MSVTVEAGADGFHQQAMGGWGHLNENGAGLKKQRRVIKIWSEIMDGRVNIKQPKIPGNDGSTVDTGGERAIYTKSLPYCEKKFGNQKLGLPELPESPPPILFAKRSYNPILIVFISVLTFGNCEEAEGSEREKWKAPHQSCKNVPTMPTSRC